MDFSLKTIDSSTHNTTTIILEHRIDRKIRRLNCPLWVSQLLANSAFHPSGVGK